ncbi:MAG: hypothetical protein V1742_09365 [Pseudomonadota bacterium]
MSRVKPQGLKQRVKATPFFDLGPGPELDSLVQVLVIGRSYNGNPPPYSTDSSLFFTVVQAMRAKGCSFGYGVPRAGLEHHTAQFWQTGRPVPKEITRTDPALAVSVAALVALEFLENPEK